MLAKNFKQFVWRRHMKPADFAPLSTLFLLLSLITLTTVNASRE